MFGVLLGRMGVCFCRFTACFGGLLVFIVLPLFRFGLGVIDCRLCGLVSFGCDWAFVCLGIAGLGLMLVCVVGLGFSCLLSLLCSFVVIDSCSVATLGVSYAWLNCCVDGFVCGWIGLGYAGLPLVYGLL